MSTAFTGVTFSEQKVTPSDDAIIRRAILPDGILSGCEISYSGSTLTMAAGSLMICGRKVNHPSAQNWAVVDATSGFARLVITIDLTRTATKEIFDQVVDSIEYASAEDGFTDLEQADINGSGTRYQIAACVVSLGAGGISGIVSQIPLSRVTVSEKLNFKLVGGTTQPPDPDENTIWVNTDALITSYIFSASQPERAEEGMIWILTSASSVVAFSATKDNPLILYPTGCSQYVSGAWVGVTAKSYMGGEWKDWLQYLYKAGDQYADITGGWVRGEGSGSASITDSAMTLATTADSPRIHVETKEKMDLTKYSKLCASVNVTKYSPSSGAALQCRLGYAAAAGANLANLDTKTVQAVTQTGQLVLELDISAASGSHYIVFGLGYSAMTVQVEEVWLV